MCARAGGQGGRTRGPARAGACARGGAPAGHRGAAHAAQLGLARVGHVARHLLCQEARGAAAAGGRA
eukprot:4261225-Prymnesium_polylepis.1